LEKTFVVREIANLFWLLK